MLVELCKDSQIYLYFFFIVAFNPALLWCGCLALPTTMNTSPERLSGKLLNNSRAYLSKKYAVLQRPFSLPHTSPSPSVVHLLPYYSVFFFFLSSISLAPSATSLLASSAIFLVLLPSVFLRYSSPCFSYALLIVRVCLLLLFGFIRFRFIVTPLSVSYRYQ